MFIASQKKKENIAEYILYMWQIEDLVRTCHFDMDLIRKQIISRFRLEEEKEKQLTEWYESIVDMMTTERIRDKGHLQMVRNTLDEADQVHKALLYSMRHPDYTSSYYKVLPLIAELRAKEQNADANDMEVCLNFLYGILLLRLQKKEISQQTLESQQQIARFMALLSKKYKLYKEERLELGLD
ncbi:MAG: DUF4924 family protein [Paludibacteraceae bacterium]|nr:DUF4924 family protein [Paludibacteraceae bacterium]